MEKVPRNEQIDIILEKVKSQLPYEMGVKLEKYISNLEANQNDLQGNDIALWDSENPPIWSHAMYVQRAQRIHERAIKKRNIYQKK